MRLLRPVAAILFLVSAAAAQPRAPSGAFVPQQPLATPVAPSGARHTNLIAGLPLVPAPISSALSQRVKPGKVRVNLPALQQATVMEGARVLWTGGDGVRRALDPVPTILSTPPPTPPVQIPARITQFDAYVAGQAGPTPPPALSIKSRQSAVGDQRDRGTCTAFATLGAIEAAYQTPGLNLSEEDAWWHVSSQANRSACIDGTHVSTALDLFSRFDVGASYQWGYRTRSELGCPANNAGTLPMSSRPSGVTQFARWGILPGQYIHRWRKNDLASDVGAFANNPRQIEAWVAAGYEVILGMGVAADLGSSAVVDVALDDDGEPLGAWAGHSMLVVGYDRAARVFELKNSWGTAAGNAGYTRISYDYVRTHASAAGVVLAVKPPRAVSAVDELNATKPATSRWTVSGCVFQTRENMNIGGAYYPYDVRVPLGGTTLTKPGNFYRFDCPNDSDCATYTRVPNVTYGAGNPSRKWAWAPANLAQDSTLRRLWEAAIRACGPG